jgi:hypothetical protein
MYSWYLNAQNIDVKHLWENALLSVDTNVLLDLYRYHDETRMSILDAMRYFSGRTWLSYQASEEFFRNRKKAIVSVSSEFSNAISKIDEYKKELDKIISALSSVRVIPKSISVELQNGADAQIQKAISELKSSQEAFPKFLDSDPVLDSLLVLFEGAVGDRPSESELNELYKIAKKRVEEKVPPGYMDAGKKEGNRQFGDFLLWNQIVEHAKKVKRPIILVTSERKEDWWEVYSGKTVGPRMEMVEEAMLRSGQLIYIVQTERFLKLHGDNVGKPIDPRAVAEIGDLSKDRARSTSLVRTAVRFLQDVGTADECKNYGEVHVDLIRPVYSFTCSGKLEPKMLHAPLMSARLSSGPEGIPKYVVSPGTGTTFDFNIKIRSLEKNVLLPLGRYVFQYEADCFDFDINLEVLE